MDLNIPYSVIGQDEDVSGKRTYSVKAERVTTMISSEYVVILWLVPVTLSIILPLAICFSWLAVRCVKDLASGKIPFIDYFSGQHYTKDESLQRRKELRIPLEKRLSANISDGIGSFSGLVTNISRMGLCLRNVPDMMSTSREFVSVVIKSGEDELELVGRPRWQFQQQPQGKVIGLEITSAPASWNDFVFSH